MGKNMYRTEHVPFPHSIPFTRDFRYINNTKGNISTKIGNRNTGTYQKKKKKRGGGGV